MIEINLLKSGHGVLYRQNTIRHNIAHRRSKIFLLLILLLTSYLTFHIDIEKVSALKYSLITLIFSQLDIKDQKDELPPRKSEEKIKTQPLSTQNQAKDQNIKKKVKVSLEIQSQKKDKISLKKHEDSTVNQSPKEKSGKNLEKQKFFHVKVASTILSESADVIEKDLLQKGFKSTRGRKMGVANKLFVIIYLGDNQKNLKIILEKIKGQEATWNPQKTEKGYQLISQPIVFLKKAESLKKQVIKKGFKGKIIQRKTPTSFHEVWVGNFKTRESAISTLKKLQLKGIQGVIVERVALF